MSMHLRDKPPSLRKLDPSVPDELADLVHEMLAKEPDARPRMADVVSTLEELGAYRTRRMAPVRAAGASGTQDRPRAPFLTLQQAFGQTFQSQQAKRFTIAIGLAVLLVLASAVLLFHDGTPNPASNPPVTDQVSWTIESAPPGAAILSADSGELLARTPWQRAAPRESGQLRVELRLEGYESTTVVLSRSQSIQQKILLSPIAQPGRAASPLPAGRSEPGSDGARPAGTSEQAQTLIRCDLSSRPRGATVIRSEDGKELGTTPLKLDAQVPGKQLKVTLKLAGYQDASVILDKDTSARQIIALSRKKK
jgi:serine/threonine-protein kinase